MAETILLKNQTGSPVIIDDLGAITVPASGQIDIGDAVPWEQITRSADLVTAIEGDYILINDGESDLNKANSLNYIRPQSRWLPEPTRADSTGLLTGGIISINGGDNTKFDISAGEGHIIDNYTDPINPVHTHVTWNAFTAQTVTNLAAADITRIAIDGNGAIVQSASAFTAAQERDYIVLGGLVHPNRTTISSVSISPRVVYGVMNNFNDFAEAFGPFNVTGNVFGPNGANLLVNKSSGQSYRLGSGYSVSPKVPNISSDSLITALSTYIYTYRDGASSWTNAYESAIDPDYYDDDSGALHAVTSGYWTIQTIYFGYPSTVAVQYGQTEYATKADALSALRESIEINPSLSQTVFRSWLIVKQGATVLNDTDYAVFVDVGKFGNVISTSTVGGGEINTASNAGDAGYGPYYQKLGVDLQFKNIAANSSKVAVTDDATGHNIKIDVNEGNVQHQNLNGAGTNTHAQIDTHVGSTSNPHSVTKTQVGLSNVTNDAQIPKSIGTAKGDVIGFSASATPVRVAVGTNNYVLTADSAQASGVKWAPASGGTYGSYFYRGVSAADSSTTSGTYQQKLRVTTDSLPSGTYRIGFYYEWQKSGVTDFASRVQVNDTDTIMEGLEEAVDPGSDQWFVRGGFGYYTGSGVLNLDLDYHANSSDTAYIRRARIEIWRVS